MSDAALNSSVRPLSGGDIERVVAIDRVHSEQARRHFFEKRFSAAEARPDEFVHLGVTAGDTLQGFAVARILRGEFGQRDAVAVLDALGVDPASRERGLGQMLIEGLFDIVRRRNVQAIHSQVSWANPDLLRFFNAASFELAPRLALERSVADLVEDIES